ncbi:GIN domain-containing protein [Nostoc sp. CCY0012]|uniref:GIN domain-containing protein n=1 Tax=Nostoc sp. CCY0012 TaxID=1056123 RepID=UPI0039C5E286
MKSNLSSLVACLTALSLLTGCSLNLGGLRGSGIAKTESREVSGFSSISSKSVGKVTIQQTGKESLTITADDNILPLLESRVAEKVLYLTIMKDTHMNPIKPIEFVVEVKSLESLNIDGVGSVEVTDIQGKQLSISLDGVGSMTIAGSVDVLELDLSGVGSFQGENFQTKQATVRNSGVGSAVVNVSEQLDATVSGVGSIEYIGSPQVRESGRGVGSVKKR